MSTNDCDDLLTKARRELNNGNKEAAAIIFNQALALNPESEEAIVNLVGYHGARKEFDKCESLLIDAISASPQMARYPYMLGSLLLQNGYHSKSVKQFEKALAIDSENVQIKVALAETHGKHGNFDAALDVLLPMLENNPPVFAAVMVFANISIVLNMNEDCQILLDRLSKTSLNPSQTNQLEATKQMLSKTIM